MKNIKKVMLNILKGILVLLPYISYGFILTEIIKTHGILGIILYGFISLLVTIVFTSLFYDICRDYNLCFTIKLKKSNKYKDAKSPIYKIATLYDIYDNCTYYIDKYELGYISNNNFGDFNFFICLIITILKYKYYKIGTVICDDNFIKSEITEELIANYFEEKILSMKDAENKRKEEQKEQKRIYSKIKEINNKYTI